MVTLENLTKERLASIYETLIASRPHINNKEIALHHIINFIKYCVLTLDEHDVEHPFKPIDLDNKEYLVHIIQAWLGNKLILIAKSRQMMVTWLFSILLLWDAMFKDGRLNIIISKKEDDADKVLRRIKGVYSRLPPFIRDKIPAKRSPSGEIGSYCKLEFEDNCSQIIGLSSNPDHIRQNTASNIFFDEMAFFERARDCYVAAMPSIRGGGKFIGCSTPCGKNFFYKLYSDIT